jgi:hypothetical protein
LFQSENRDWWKSPESAKWGPGSDGDWFKVDALAGTSWRADGETRTPDPFITRTGRLELHY